MGRHEEALKAKLEEAKKQDAREAELSKRLVGLDTSDLLLLEKLIALQIHDDD
jgi:hypothetical protein